MKPSDQAVERGETYEHAIHGPVKVSGIWKGTNEVDAIRDMNEKEMIIVLVTTKEDGEQADKLTYTLPEFLEAINY